MEFPAYLTIVVIKLYPHRVFESIAYFVSLRLALRRFRNSTVQPEQRGVVIAGSLIGGMLGAKLLTVVQHLDLLWTGQADIGMLLISGKTIVGHCLEQFLGLKLPRKYSRLRQPQEMLSLIRRSIDLIKPDFNPILGL